MQVLIIVLLAILVIFGIASGMNSYASAKQAQATIEVAKVAQVNAWGNLVTILTVVLMIVILVAIAAAVLWMFYRRLRSQRTPEPQAFPRQSAQTGMNQIPNLNVLVQLEMLRMLRSLNPPATNQTTPLLSQRTDEESPVEYLHWLR